MACKIIWTKRAWLTFENNINYLQTDWTEKEISKFILLTQKRLAILSNSPRIGTSRNTNNPNLLFTLIHKRVALIYRHKPLKNEIELLVFWNTAQNPRKLFFK